MTGDDRFKQRVKNLMSQQGCSLDEAIDMAKALKEFNQLADQADELRQIKQELEWEMRFGGKG